jgi:hypothetical protein
VPFLFYSVIVSGTDRDGERLPRFAWHSASLIAYRSIGRVIWAGAALLLLELGDPIVRRLNGRTLTPHDLSDGRRQIDMDGIPVVVERHVLAMFTFGQDIHIVMAADSFLQLDPTVMELARKTSRVDRMGAHAANFELEFLGQLRPLPTVVGEENPQMRVGNVIGSRSKSLFRIATGFNQAVQGGKYVIGLVCHGNSSSKKRARHPGTFSPARRANDCRAVLPATPFK